MSFAGRALVPLILRQPPHEERPIWIERVVVPDHEGTSGPDDTAHLPDRPPHDYGIDEVVEHRERGHDVEARFLEWKVVGPRVDDIQATSASDGEHLVRYVDAVLLIAGG